MKFYHRDCFKCERLKLQIVSFSRNLNHSLNLSLTSFYSNFELPGNLIFIFMSHEMLINVPSNHEYPSSKIRNIFNKYGYLAGYLQSQYRYISTEQSL